MSLRYERLLKMMNLRFRGRKVHRTLKHFREKEKLSFVKRVSSHKKPSVPHLLSTALRQYLPQPTSKEDLYIPFNHDNLSTAIMGRLHSNGKGISGSAIPYSRTPPAWLKTTPDQIVEQICKLAKKGASPSQIGTSLRDAHGISQ